MWAEHMFPSYDPNRITVLSRSKSAQKISCIWSSILLIEVDVFGIKLNEYCQTAIIKLFNLSHSSEMPVFGYFFCLSQKKY